MESENIFFCLFVCLFFLPQSKRNLCVFVYVAVKCNFAVVISKPEQPSCLIAWVEALYPVLWD